MLLRAAKSGVQRIFHRLGFDLVRRNPRPSGPPDDFDDATRRLYDEVRPYTMSGVERVAALCQAVQYIVHNNIPGDMVECGVWKGGSMMAVAKALLAARAADRRLRLFDTFEGMTPPTAADVNFRGHDAAALLDAASGSKASTNIWAVAPLDAVKEAMQSTGYDPRLVEYVRGPVEQTLPAHAPSQVALLRLDTDWYESTYHELVHLYPRLARGGVLIIDDYGHWQGARRAVDQYIAENKLRILLNRIDYTARIGVKLEE